MSTPSWRTSLAVRGFDRDTGRALPITVGLIETDAGGVQVALRVGEDGAAVLLPLQDAGQLELNLREVLAQRFRLAVDKLGGEGS